MSRKLDQPRIGDLIKAPWASHVILIEVVCTVTVTPLPYMFFGVMAETQYEPGWPGFATELLWVYSDGSGLKLWNDFHQKPLLGERQYQEIEEICGFCELRNGDVYYAVRWLGYTCPTWELERPLFSHEGYLPQKTLREY